MDTQTHILNSPYPQGKFFLIFLHEGGGFVNFNSFNISTISLTSLVKDSKTPGLLFTLTQGTKPESMNPWMMTFVGLVALKLVLATAATDVVVKNS